MGWPKQLKLIVSFSLVLLLMPLNASAADNHTLIPMGHSIGIKLDLSGLFVTNDVLVNEDEWLNTGDSLEQVDGVGIQTLDHFERTVSKVKNQNLVPIHVLRNGETIKIQAESEAVKRLIPFLKDSTEGTGTLTYVDPLQGTYGALGHQIIDSSLKAPPSFKDGSIFLSQIEQIRKSTPGNPGYKISGILKNEKSLGTVSKNDIYGIFGLWTNEDKKFTTEPLEVVKSSEVKEGNAEIFTTVHGTTVESFSIRIIKLEDDQFHFVLTDPKLLEQTGGILQGMSGSPIIQNNKFVGAVTHMFVDEPEKGAALFLETMREGEK